MRILSKIIAFSTILFVFTFNVLSTYASTSGTVIGSGVNVRSSPSTSARIIMQVENGQKVTITGTESGFYHVYFPGMTDGWISTQFVTASAPPPSGNALPAPSQSTGRVNGTDVNIRSQPSTSATVLGRANTGDSFKILEQQDGWYKISYNNTDAYISGMFFSVASSAESASPSQTGSNQQQQETQTGSSQQQQETQTGSNQQQQETQTGSNQQQGTIQAEPSQVGGEGQHEAVFATVTSGTGLYLRQRPTQESPALCKLAFGTVLDVDSIDADWIAVTYNGTKGYVSALYVNVERGIKPVTENISEVINPLAHTIIEYGKQFIGTPYAYGGTNLNKGVDCSGFVYMVMKEHGITLNRSSITMVNNGVTVQRSQLQPGDLVFFATSGGRRISHVGIYIGNKKFIHSSSSRSSWGVTISSLDEPTYNRQYVTANRVL